MLIASGLAIAVLTASPPQALLPSGMPPFAVDVTAASDISPAVIGGALAEAAAIWRGAGVNLVWRTQPSVAPALHVIIGGGRTDDRRAPVLPLGWIVFGKDKAPVPEIYVSHGNATALLMDSKGVVGPSDRMPQAQRELYLARAMGRALAHEIGHFLLASKTHARAGLMAARYDAAELFGISRAHFALDAAQRRLIASRFTSIYIASRH